jgi:hypothetical protein
VITFYTPCGADFRRMGTYGSLHKETTIALIVRGQRDGELPPAHWTRKTAAHREREHGVGETFNHCPVPSFQRFPSFQHILSSFAFGHYSARMPSDAPEEYVSEYGLCLLCVGGILSHECSAVCFYVHNTRLTKDCSLLECVDV